MLHPFITDLSSKSLEEIQSTISGLMSKLTFAHRIGNGPLVHQLNMALESYKSEHAKRMDEMLKSQNIKTKIDIKKENER